VGPVSGSLLESRPPRAAHPDRPSCVAVSVRPSSRQARRTAPPVFNGVNALAFGTLFSSQGASADPKEGTPKRWGRATHHGRHVSLRRQPRPITRPRTPPARHHDSRNPSRRWPVPADRNEQGSATPRPGGTVEGRCRFGATGRPRRHAPSRRVRRPAPRPHRMSDDVCVGEGGISMEFGARAHAPAPGAGASSRSSAGPPSAPRPPPHTSDRA